MLAIRMQRTGRKGHAQFRVVVQESRWAPTSGRVVARLGHYNPHTKSAVLDKEKAGFYLEHGAQPSDRVVKLFETQDIELPKWVKKPSEKKRTIRNPEKLRKNQPKEEAPEAQASTEQAEGAGGEASAEEPKESETAEASKES